MDDSYPFFMLYKYLIYRYIDKKRRKVYPSKNNCRNCLLSENPIHNSSKRQINNKIDGRLIACIWTIILGKRTKSVILGSLRWPNSESKPSFSMPFTPLGEQMCFRKFGIKVTRKGVSCFKSHPQGQKTGWD